MITEILASGVNSSVPLCSRIVKADLSQGLHELSPAVIATEKVSNCDNMIFICVNNINFKSDPITTSGKASVMNSFSVGSDNSPIQLSRFREFSTSTSATTSPSLSSGSEGIVQEFLSHVVFMFSVQGEPTISKSPRKQ